jgi:hypothetical protein
MLMSDLRFLNSRDDEEKEFTVWIDRQIDRQIHRSRSYRDRDIVEQPGSVQEESDNDSTVLDDVKNHLN